MTTPESESKQKLRIDMTDITRHNVGQLKLLNTTVLPVPYSDKYYNDTVSNWPRENPWCRLAYHNEYLVGAINSRIETYTDKNRLRKATHLTPGQKIDKKPHKDADGNVLRYRLYISTLSVLEAYRNAKIGSTLMKTVLETADSMEGELDEIYVHVHVDNKQAIEFYNKFGFSQIGQIEDYYRNNVVSPPIAVVLARPIGKKAVKQETAPETQ